MLQQLMQVQAQKVDAIEDEKVGEKKLGAKIHTKHGAKDGTKPGIKPSIKPGVKSSEKPITIPGAKLGVRIGTKLSANFARSFAPYLINRHKQHQKWALDEKGKQKGMLITRFCCSARICGHPTRP